MIKHYKQKKPWKNKALTNILAAPEGFEPAIVESESTALPLGHGAIQ